MQPLARSRARALAAGGLGVIVVAVVYHAIDSIGGPDAVRERYGAWGFAVSFVAHWVLNLTPLGGFVPTAAANGALWGFWVGALVSWAGWLAASLTLYLLVRWVAGEREVSEIRARLPGWLGRLPVEHPLVQIGGRSLPWVGLHVVSVSAALVGVPLGRFLAYAALGQAGPALAMAALGSGLIAIFATSCGQDVCRHADGIVVNEQRRTFGGPSLSLVTLNLLSGGPFPSFLGLPGSEEVYDTSMRDRLALQAKGLARELPDVLVLQEVSGTAPARYCSMLDALTEGLRLEDSEAAIP